MSEPIIRVESLGKNYRLGGNPNARNQTFREQLTQQGKQFLSRTSNLLRGKLSPKKAPLQDFWALRDVSFDVQPGEVIGVVGRNGAGKSTLLKLLSRITHPSTGRITLNGRVASLLEVGTGFHPDLTGRENIFLNGAILGMSRSEILRKFDEIVDFSEVSRFLDTPVKRYSSGMFVRLAFAVAAHLEPEILIIDEVLAVGDLVFQKKCIGKMQDVAQSGRTVIFVSHNMQTVSSLTAKSLYLESGALVSYGPTKQIIDLYLNRQASQFEIYQAEPKGETAEITRVELKTSLPGNVQNFGQPMQVLIDVDTPEPIPNSAISFQVFTALHQPVLHVLNLDSEVPMLRQSGHHRLTCSFPRLKLYPGNYYLSFYFGASEPRRVFEAPKQICPFEVTVLESPRDFYWYPDNALYVEDVDWNATSHGEEI